MSDSPVRIYRYWVRPEYANWPDLPPAALQEIAAQHRLWNHLVRVFAERHRWQVFVDKARRVAKRSPTSRANGRLVLKQFFDAARRFLSKQAGPPQPKPAIPHEIHFQHRFPGSGLFAPQVFEHHEGVCLDPVPAQAWDPSLSQRLRKRLARTNGTFQVRDTLLPFQTILHRPLPEDARIKVATLVGRQTGQAGYRHTPNRPKGSPTLPRWTWALHLTLELPPPALVSHARPTAVLHLDSRDRQDRLQIATLIDSTGHKESLGLPPTIFHAWCHSQALGQQLQRCLTHAQAQLRRLPPDSIPGAEQSLFAQLATARTLRLGQLLQLLTMTRGTGDHISALQRLADRSTRLLREADGLEQHYRGHRTWVYRNLALRLCERYQRISLEGDQTNRTNGTNGKGGTTRGHHQSVVTDEQRHHDLLAIPSFFHCLSEAAAKTGTEIHHGRPRSSRPCRQLPVMKDPVQRGKS